MDKNWYRNVYAIKEITQKEMNRSLIRVCPDLMGYLVNRETWSLNENSLSLIYQGD
tara:strand:- start:94 stop:261 length:168 start_codon:yes stop_codon:yes gene_type:complete